MPYGSMTEQRVQYFEDGDIVFDASSSHRRPTIMLGGRTIPPGEARRIAEILVSCADQAEAHSLG